MRLWRLRDDSLLVSLVAAMTAVVGVLTGANVVEIFFVRDTLGGSEAMYGVVAGAWTMGVVYGAFAFGRIKGSDARLATAALLSRLGMAGAILASAGVPAALWLLPIYLVGGSFNAGLNVIAGVLVGRRVPAAFLDRAFGVFTSATNTAAMAGYVVGGALTPILPTRALIAGTGAVGVIVAVALLSRVVVTRVVAQVAGHQVPARSMGVVG